MDKDKEIMKLFDTFNCAISGVVYTLKTQRNMKIHFIIAFFVLMLSFIFGLTRIELLMVLFAICLVIVAEMINTAIECAIDLISKEYHPLAGTVKNVAAGAVLVAAGNALLVGYLVFIDKINIISLFTMQKVIDTPAHITFILLIIVIMAVIVFKSRGEDINYLKGGMPSGHSAVAFSIVIIIAFLTENVLITTLALLLSIMVVQSRIEGKIHSAWQVTVGALLGIIISVLFFQMIR